MSLVSFLRRLRGRDDHPAAAGEYELDSQPRIPSTTNAARAEMYDRVATVATAVDDIAGDVADTPYAVYYRNQEVEDHPLVQLLESPNKYWTGFEFLEETMIYLQVFGNAYWLLRGEGERLESIWPLRPDRVRVEPSRTKLAEKYWYEVASRTYDFMPEEIVHFKTPSVMSDRYGDGRVHHARYDVNTEFLMSSHQLSFFGEDVTQPAGVWVFPASLSWMMFRRAVRNLKRDHRGGRRKTAYIRANTNGEQTVFVPTGLSQEEMAFVDSRQQFRDVILERLGLPAGYMAKSSTEAHARVAERRKLAYVHRWHRRLAAKITKEIVPLYGQNQVFRFADVRVADQSQVLQKFQAMSDFTPDERREILFGASPLTELQRGEIDDGGETEQGVRTARTE